MKINQSFIFNNKNEEIKMLEKPTFNRYVLENIQKQGKIKITSKDFTKLNSMSYEEIVKEKTNLFKKITNGIYCLKISDNEIIGILINKTIEDFKRIYEKNKNKTKAGKEIREIDKDKRLLKIEGEKEVKISNFTEQLEANKIISNEIRNMKVDKEMVKNNVKRMTIVGLAAVAGMSLFACKKPEAPIPNADIRIDVDADISDGNKINEKEVKTQINEKHLKDPNKYDENGNEYNALNTKKWMTIDGKTYNRATGKPRTVEETIGDLEIVSKEEIKSAKYKNSAYKVQIVDKNGNTWEVGISPYIRVSMLVDKDGRETIVSGNVATAEELIATANAMDNISRNMGAIK